MMTKNSGGKKREKKEEKQKDQILCSSRRVHTSVFLKQENILYFFRCTFKSI